MDPETRKIMEMMPRRTIMGARLGKNEPSLTLVLDNRKIVVIEATAGGALYIHEGVQEPPPVIQKPQVAHPPVPPAEQKGGGEQNEIGTHKQSENSGE